MWSPSSQDGVWREKCHPNGTLFQLRAQRDERGPPSARSDQPPAPLSRVHKTHAIRWGCKNVFGAPHVRLKLSTVLFYIIQKLV